MLANTRGCVACKVKGKCEKFMNVVETLNLVDEISEVPHGGIYLTTFRGVSSMQIRSRSSDCFFTVKKLFCLYC